MENSSKKVAVITGAAGGIGSEITKRFLGDGYNVCATDVSSEALEKLTTDLGNPQDLMVVKADISNEESCNNLHEEVAKKWNAVDVIINNAGWFPFMEFEKMTYADWRKVTGINLDGTFLVTKSLLPLLKQSTAGRIINTASGSLFDPPPGQAHYVASKAGVIGLTRALAVELGQYNITVNAITPGLTATPIVLKSFPPELIDKLAQQGALKRRQQPEDLVGAFAFLASDDASFITGQTFNTDGGRTFL